jgi:hypothetical protein
MADNSDVAPNSKLVPRIGGMGVLRMSQTDFLPEAGLPTARSTEGGSARGMTALRKKAPSTGRAASFIMKVPMISAWRWASHEGWSLPI